VSTLRCIWAIVAKDLTAELRTKERVTAMGLFAALVVLLFSFSLEPAGPLPRAAAPAVLWVTITFTGMLGLTRSFAREDRYGTLDGLMLAPMGHGVILAGKALSNLLFMCAVGLVLLPVVSTLFDVSLLRGEMVLVLLLGMAGYAGIGTLLAAIAMNARAQAVALPLLMLPLVAPAFLAAVRATDALLRGATLTDVSHWIRLLVLYDTVLLIVALVTFGYVMEE